MTYAFFLFFALNLAANYNFIMQIFKALTFGFIFFWISAVPKAYAQCTANAGADTSICLGASAQIGGLPAGTGTGTLTYSWSPATGLSCTNCPNPVVTPTANQIYALTVTDSGTPTPCSTTDQISVTIDPVPTANFTITGNNTCSNVGVQFTNTSTGTGLTYSWNFGSSATPATAPPRPAPRWWPPASPTSPTSRAAPWPGRPQVSRWPSKGPKRSKGHTLPASTRPSSAHGMIQPFGL